MTEESKTPEVTTLDNLITGEGSQAPVLIDPLELDTLKFTLDTLMEVMKDVTFKIDSLEGRLHELQGEVNLMKSPLAKKRPTVTNA